MVRAWPAAEDTLQFPRGSVETNVPFSSTFHDPFGSTLLQQSQTAKAPGCFFRCSSKRDLSENHAPQKHLKPPC